MSVHNIVSLVASEAYLDTHADLYWSTDYWVSRDKNATKTRRPIYQTLNSSITPISNEGMQVRFYTTIDMHQT